MEELSQCSEAGLTLGGIPKDPWYFADYGQVPCSNDPESWHPETSELSSENRMAIKVCEGCMFKEPCLQYAIENDVSGIWGATTYSQRKRIRKDLSIKAKPISIRRKPREEKE